MSNENLAAEAVTSMVLALAAEAADHGKTVSAQSVLRDLGLDHLDAVELVMAVEAEFGVDLDGAFGNEDDPETFLPLTVQALIDATLEAMKRRAEDQGAAVPDQCQGTSCAASASNGYDHSPECIVEAAEAQGWADAPEAIEAKIQAKGLNAPRVTKARIDDLMGRIVYTFDVRPNGSTTTLAHAFLDGKFYLATGVSACVSVENFDAELGKDIATRNAQAAAEDELWKLEDYLLRERLSAPTLTLNLSESQQAELLEQIRNAPPGTLVMQATDGGPNPSYSPEHDAAFAALELVRAFVAKHRISCPETIHQTDRVIEDAYGFIQDLVDVAGYHREPGDADGEEVQP